MNSVNLVGRITRTPTLFITDTGKKGTVITLAIGRPFKNQNGEYESDFIDCTMWSGIAETTAEYCDKGDIVGIKGRLQTKIIEQEDGTKYKRMDIIANTISFIYSNKINHESNIKENITEEDSGIEEIPENNLESDICNTNDDKNVDDLKPHKHKKK